MAPEVSSEYTAAVEALKGPPPAEGVRNINYDVHVGDATQRPYARIEDMLGSTSQAWLNVEELRNALPDGQEVLENPDGTLYRLTLPKETGDQVLKDGVLYNKVRREKRKVALSLSAAKVTKSDFWNGFTWVLDGQKLQEMPHEMRIASREDDTELVPASDQDQTLMANSIASRNMLNPLARVQQAQVESSPKPEPKAKASKGDD